MNNSVVDSLLGNTPIVQLGNLFEKGNLYAKLEYYNPTFSIKDRAAFNMVKQAFEDGKLHEGDTIIEATSGNTGLGLCFAARAFNLKVICTVFSDVPVEKINLLQALGAVVIVCDSRYESSSEQGYVGVAKRIADEMEDVFYIQQFNNINNIMAHYKTTGPEIWKQMNGKLDYLFATIGTGGTISGLGMYLKEKNPDIKVIGVEPVGGIYRDHFYHQEEHYVDHLIQSISDDFISDNFLMQYVDDVIQVEDSKSFSMCYEIMRTEGLCVGTSSGCVLAAARDYLKEDDKTAVCIIPDMGLKYMNTLFNKEYLAANNLQIEEEPSRSSLVDRMKQYCGAEKMDCKIY